MKIKATSTELSAEQIYNLTMNPETMKMRDFKDKEIEIEAWAIYEDVDKKTGEVKEILTILTPDGEVIGTNSETLRNDLLSMVELFTSMGKELASIEIVGGVSKAGREFITCKMASLK